jgi:hypothetical protein
MAACDRVDFTIGKDSKLTFLLAFIIMPLIIDSAIGSGRRPVMANGCFQL